MALALAHLNNRDYAGSLWRTPLANAFFYQPSPAPGRETTPAQPVAAPAPGQPEAQQPAGGLSQTMFLLLPLVLIGFMFFMTRNQTKKQKQLEDSLKAGDRVQTQSGLLGRIDELGEKIVKLEIAPGVKVQITKTSIIGRDGGDSKPADKSDKKDDDKK